MDLKNLWFSILGRTVYRRLILFERRLDEPIAPDANGAFITVALLTPDALDEYLAFRPHPAKAEIERRLERGEKCFLAREGGVIASAGWAAVETARIDYLGCEIELAGDTVYIYESFTAPQFRNRNIPALRAKEMIHHFRQLGYVRFLGAILPENKAGLRPAAKTGYKPIGVIRAYRLGRWRRVFRVRAEIRWLQSTSAQPFKRSANEQD